MKKDDRNMYGLDYARVTPFDFAEIRKYRQIFNE